MLKYMLIAIIAFAVIAAMCACDGDADPIFCDSAECNTDGDISDGEAAEESSAENREDEETEMAPECSRDIPCTGPLVCDEATGVCILPPGVCMENAHCDMNMEYCHRDAGQDYGHCEGLCYRPGMSCPAMTECCGESDERLYCRGWEGRCINPGVPPVCMRAADCPSTSYCEILVGHTSGYCRATCSGNGDCPEGLVCRDDGRCGAGMQDGDCGGDPCPIGYICDPLFNTCILNCPTDCGLYECCDAYTAPECRPICTCNNPTICGLLLESCCFGYTCSAMVYGVLGFCI